VGNGNLDEDGEEILAYGTWMEGDIIKMPPGEQYLASIYFTITTITTVGYGDVTIRTKMEKIFCIFLMLVGVLAFSFVSGSLASSLQSYDTESALYKEKLTILNKIYKEYEIGLDLYTRMKTTINVK
jgi:hypothetical protein